MDLNINYQETRNTGNQVKSQADQFGSLLGEIQSANDELKNCWKGADAQSYTQKIDEQAQVMKKLQATIDEIGVFLVKVGDAYEDAIESNKM